MVACIRLRPSPARPALNSSRRRSTPPGSPGDGPPLTAAKRHAPREGGHRGDPAGAEPPRPPVFVPSPEPEPEVIAWPTLSLPRGPRWHGLVTIDNPTAERSFISP